MKKKTMQAWFAVLFIAGLVVGLLVPVDLKTLSKKISAQGLKPEMFDVPKRLGQLDIDATYFKYSILARTDTGSVELARIDDRIPMHMHPKESHFVYIYRGSAKVTVGNSIFAAVAGQLIAIPAKAPHSIERTGDSPVEMLVFSTPPFEQNDTVALEK